MSKATIKKLLKTMPKEEIIGMILEMYDARKEAKEYLEYYAKPDEEGKLEEYKKIITEEFYPTKGRQEPKTRFAVCRKAVLDYKKLKPSADKLADLMLCYVENACRFTYEYGDMWDQYYTSVEKNFDNTLSFIACNDLLDHFRPRLKQCVEWASPCGWAFGDTLFALYCEYFGEWEEEED